MLTGFYRNSLPGEPSHFFYDISDITIRSYCGRFEMLRSTLYEAAEVSCPVCLGGDEVTEESEVRLSGAEPDLSTEEYMTIFNRMVNDGEELGYHLPAVKDMTPEELVDHVNLLSRFSSRIRIAKQAAKVTLEAKRIHLDGKQREALKLRDMQYKPKPAPSPDSSKTPRRKAGTAKTIDAIEGIMRLMGCTREQAEKRLEKVTALAELAETDGGEEEGKK